MKNPSRIVSILTDTGRYYESHEVYDFSLRVWCGEEFFDLSESDAADKMRESPQSLEVDVSAVEGMDGTPVASCVLIGDERVTS